jgi:hypothetical protein
MSLKADLGFLRTQLAKSRGEEDVFAPGRIERLVITAMADVATAKDVEGLRTSARAAAGDLYEFESQLRHRAGRDADDAKHLAYAFELIGNGSGPLTVQEIVAFAGQLSRSGERIIGDEANAIATLSRWGLDHAPDEIAMRRELRLALGRTLAGDAKFVSYGAQPMQTDAAQDQFRRFGEELDKRFAENVDLASLGKIPADHPIAREIEHLVRTFHAGHGVQSQELLDVVRSDLEPYRTLGDEEGASGWILHQARDRRTEAIIAALRATKLPETQVDAIVGWIRQINEDLLLPGRETREDVSVP